MGFANIFLIGYRGAGKTTVARLVAERLGWSWVDSDDRVESDARESIAQIFATRGESAFRDLEEQVIAQLCENAQGDAQKTVIALGGGAVLRPATRDRIQAAGPVVWLTASPGYLADRLQADESTPDRRPGLTGQGVLAEIEQVLALRTPIYQACATFTVDTQGKTPDQIADEILGKLGSKPGIQ